MTTTRNATHDNPRTGSLATPCRRCGLAFAWQTFFKGLPCGERYNYSEDQILSDVQSLYWLHGATQPEPWRIERAQSLASTARPEVRAFIPA